MIDSCCVAMIDRMQVFCGGWLTVVAWQWLTGGMCFVVDDWQLLCDIDWQEASVLWWMLDSCCVALIDRRHVFCGGWLTLVVWHWLTWGICFVVDDWQLSCGIDWQEASEVRCMSFHPSGDFMLVGTNHPTRVFSLFCSNAMLLYLNYCSAPGGCRVLWWVSLSVSVCAYTSTTTCQYFTKFSIQVTRGCDRSVSNDSVFPVLWMTSVFTQWGKYRYRLWVVDLSNYLPWLTRLYHCIAHVGAQSAILDC